MNSISPPFQVHDLRQRLQERGGAGAAQAARAQDRRAARDQGSQREARPQQKEVSVVQGGRQEGKKVSQN